MRLFRFWLAVLLLASAASRAADDRVVISGEPRANSLERFAALDPATRKQPIQSVFQFAGVPVPGLLDIRFSLPAGRYKGRLIDLNLGVEESVEVNGVQTFTIPNTRDDFVLVIAPQELRRRAGMAATEHACNVSVSC